MPVGPVVIAMQDIGYSPRGIFVSSYHLNSIRADVVLVNLRSGFVDLVKRLG
jgi:hypothetical protein